MSKPIKSPEEDMTPQLRAAQMWAVHPSDLDRLGFQTRIDFYEAHIQNAIRQALEDAPLT